MTLNPSEQAGNLDRDPVGHHTDDPYRWHAIIAVLTLAMTLPMLLFFVVGFQAPRGPVRWAHFPVATTGGPDGVAVAVSLGEATYASSCALCHGANAEGVARLGKPLRNSAYVQDHSDDELFTLIATGRLPSDEENTTGALMPARGAQGLPDDKINAVVGYLREIQDPTQPPVSIDDWILETAGDDGEQVAGLVGESAGVSHNLFIASCAACHGTSGEGVEGLGKALDTSEFVASKTDEELIKFIRSGRPIWDADNTTGLDMPPKGGNPAITDEQLADIVKYLRSIHE